MIGMHSRTWEWPHAVAVPWAEGRVYAAYDGDTFRCDIDLGMNVWWRGATVRLSRVDAPELREPLGPAFRDLLRSIVPIGALVSLRSVGYDKYGGRVDAEVWLPDGRNLNDLIGEATIAS